MSARVGFVAPGATVSRAFAATARVRRAEARGANANGNGNGNANAAAAARRRARVSCVAEVGGGAGSSEAIEAQRASGMASGRPTGAEQARTIAQKAQFALLSTMHEVKKAGGEDATFPYGSAVQIAVDAEGRPIFGISTLSAHTRDLAHSPRVSVTVLDQGFASVEDARFTLVGECVRVPDEQQDAVKAAYREKHPNAFWLDFGDFAMYRVETVHEIRLVGGFGRAQNVSPGAYARAEPDPLLAFANRIIGHMNDDHEGEIMQIVRHYAPEALEPEQVGGASKKIVSAKMEAIDKVGMDVRVVADAGDRRVNWKQRVVFPFLASDRKKAKEVLVEMTKASAAAGAATDAAPSEQHSTQA